MPSWKKILIVTIISIIAIVGVVGYIAFSFNNSNVTLSNSRITDNITSDGDLLNPTFGGNINLEQDIFIYNSGILDINDLEVQITVFFIGNIDPTEVKLGSGVNNLGDIPSQQNVSRTLEITLTDQLPRLAVEDGVLRIVIETNLKLENINYTIEIPTKETLEQWEAPFSL